MLASLQGTLRFFLGGSVSSFSTADFGGRCSTRSQLFLVCLCLVALTVAVYFQVGGHEFLNYDDDAYVTGNAHVTGGLSLENTLWAFTSVEAANWHPLTWISHQLDVQLFGLAPRGHHLSSLAIHCVSTLCLLFWLLRSTGALWPSALVAALFALHPMHVESVAWVAERKDVLSGLFFFLTLIAYSRFVERRGLLRYLLALLFFLLGLMSKPMLVSLPLVLLLLDYWPHRRLGGEGEPAGQVARRAAALIVEKIPFIAATLFSCAMTMRAQSGAISDTNLVPVALRLENALVAYLRYLGKTVWPWELGMLYPHPQSIPLWQVAGALVALVLITGVVLLYRRSFPYLATGWFWFLITLLPVLGLVQVGAQAMADRYSYLPSIGLYICAAWGARDLARRFPLLERSLPVFAGIAIIACAALTYRQAGFWSDNVTLYRHTLEVTRDNVIVHDNLGLTLSRQGDWEGAISEYRAALGIAPSFKQSHLNLGIALVRRGQLEEGIREYLEALRLAPDYKEAHNNLGLALARKGDLDGAIRQYQEALRVKPQYVEALCNLGVALARKGDVTGAVEKLQEALRLRPHDQAIRRNLERALSMK
jgi:protein O-mannosyl-transferase